ncbi:MAG: redoxin domain-containing protein [Planctomycetota bacterium]
MRVILDLSRHGVSLQLRRHQELRMSNITPFRLGIFHALVAVVLVGTWTRFCSANKDTTVTSATLKGMRLLDVQGERHQLFDTVGCKATVLVFLSHECPICAQYVPELHRLFDRWSKEPVAFFGVISDPTLSRAKVLDFQKSYSVRFPVLFDPTFELASQFGPTHVPEAFVIDGSGHVVYRGRIDDLYPEAGKRRPSPTTSDLATAVDAILKGEQIKVARTEPVGCKLQRTSPNVKEGSVTFTRHIASILYANCTECHRPGEVAPFALLSYDDAAKRADWIAENVASGAMPPWKAAEDFGHFIAERRLTEKQRELIVAWAKAGAPKGADEDMPSVPAFADGWSLGEPDLVLEAPHVVTVNAEGPDVFHHFVVPLNLPKDRDVAAVEFRPGNPRVVHHAVILLDPAHMARERDAKSPEPGYVTSGGTGIPFAGILNVWAPGVTARYLPEGIAVRLPKTADVVCQLHLHPSGKPEQDRSRIGIYYSKTPATRHIMNRPFVFGPIHIDIPPGESQHEVSASIKLPTDLTMTAVLPHMHMIGKEIKVWATLPDQSETPLIWIKDWNFNWQDQYVYREPIHLPKGSVVHVWGRYDNSQDNPFNPHRPPIRMMFGEETADEMCLALFQATSDNPKAAEAIRANVMLNIFSQLREPSVSTEYRKLLSAKVRELAGPELRATFTGGLIKD